MPSVLPSARRSPCFVLSFASSVVLSPETGHAAYRRRAASNHARLSPVALMLGLAGLLHGPAQAVDRTWQGATGDWMVDGNWNPSGVPGIGDRAIIQNGNAGLAVAAQITNLSITGGTLSGAGTLTVTGASTLSGGVQV